MNIRSVDTATVTAALVAMLEEWAALQGLNILVERNEPVNKDGGRCPWIGVYQVAHEFSLRTIGMGSGFRMQRLDLAVVMTESSSMSGEDCEARLEKLISEAVSCILSDPSLRNTMLVTSDPFRVTYTDFRQEGNLFFREAVMQFTVENPVTVTA